MLRRVTAALFILVIATSMSQLTQELTNTNRDGDVILSISDEQKIQYLSQNFESDAYKYGYDVNPHGQFHHETRGPHGITYGCYGYVDPFGKLKATFYISDGWGYRVVQPGRDVELFLHKHEHHANGDKHDHHEHHGVITPWRELSFPMVCAQYTNTNVPPLTIPSGGTPIGSGSTIETIPTRPPYRPDSSGHPNKPDIIGTPERPGKPKPPLYPGIPGTSGTPGFPGTPSYPGQPGTPGTPEFPGTPSYPGHPGTPGIPGIPGKPGKPGTPPYPGHPGIPGIPGTPGTPGFPGTPSYPGHPGTPGIPGIPGKPGKPGTPSYPGHPGTPGIPGTPGTPGFPGTPSYPGHPGTHEIPGTPGIVELPLYPTYPVTPGKPGRPSYPGYPIYPVTSETPDAPSHSETPGHPGYPAYPESTEDSKSPEGPIGGVGGIGDIGGVGDIGPDGPDGPWPTGSPGPDGPWPGDPDYIPGIKPTRRPSYKEPIRNYHPATYSFDTDKYNSISQYNFNNKTDSSYTGYTLKDIELSKLSRPTDVDTSLYLHQKPQYEIQSPIYGKKETIYNANKINSLLQTSSTPSSLKYEIEDHQYINAFKLNPQLYDHLIHTEPQQIKKPLKNDFNQFSVHDQDQYQKTIFYPSYNSQRQSKVLNEFKKLEQEEDAFNVDGQYNNSANVDSKAISNVSFQSDGPSSAPERQVNARLEQTFRTNFAVDAIGVQPPSSINVKPFSLPIGPNPQSCPCYLVEPNNNTNVETSSTLTSVIGQFGFIPVIFVPYCPGNEMDSDKMKIMFPSATPVPYACDTCDTQDSKIIVKPLDINQLGNIDYLKEALNQTNLGFLNVPVKTVERRRSKSRKAK